MNPTLENSTLLSAYPPSFAGNPWTYGIALFSLTLICALSTAKLLHFLFEHRARVASWSVSGKPGEMRYSLSSPRLLHQFIITGFLLTILLEAFPDVLILFAWGEATRDTIDALFLLDRVCDGLTSLPLLAAAAAWAYGEHVAPPQLITAQDIVIRAPQLRTFNGQIRIVGVVLVIATGVTLAKAHTGI